MEIKIKSKKYSHNKGKNHHMYGKFCEKSPAWKGEKAKYHAKHLWISYHFGKPKICSNCGTTKAKKYEWVNISRKYLRDISDYKRLCTKCHADFDSNSRAKGEKHGNSRLTNKNILEIRKSYVPRKYTLKKLAKNFNVDYSTIRLIICRKNWKHIK